MEELFLKILNMSITAGYVILVVILIRLFLKRAPKKYSYLLWSVVLFRLISPISFSSVFSIFQMKLFNMTEALKGGNTSLNFIPADIGYMKTPTMTVGIPAMNSIISESLPPAAPYVSVNPLQIWIYIGSMFWCVGIASLFVYCLITYIRMKHLVSTSVRLEGNVFESDKIRQPFILGFLKPDIFLPFGLGTREQAYILHHERFHLKRKDYLIKLFSFCVLTIHWFNPLVWLAFILMTKDMEMSCDEKVLSESGSSIIKDYSSSLLAFASNLRFPTASPLAFGETGIKERVKNILRFKTPKKRVIVFAIILSAVVAVLCIANPARKAIATAYELPIGDYKFEKQIYMNPLSSFLAFEGYMEYYTLTKNLLILTDENGNQQRFTGTYEQAILDDQQFKNSFIMSNFGLPDISKYKKKYQYTMNVNSGSNDYRIYQLDDEIWLAKMHKDIANQQKSEYIWSIYQITNTEEIPMKITISGTKNGVESFLTLQQDFKSDYDNDICYNITPDYIQQSSDFMVFKYEYSCASFLLYEGKIYPLGTWFGGYGVTSLALADMNNDQKSELYFTYSFGSGLHRSIAAYFDPVVKKVVSFDYAHLNHDMIVTENSNGGLSIYDAIINKMDSFVNFDIERKDSITDIVYHNGQISIDSVTEP